VRRGTRDTLLYRCAIAGPAIWFTLLRAAWAIAPGAPEIGRRGALLGLHVLALLFALAPGAAALREVRVLRRSGFGHPAAERARRLAGSAVVLSAISALLVIASAVPLVLLARSLR
jgi:hypothetical protein